MANIMKDAHEYVNAVAKEMLGESVIVENDLSNIVDIGRAISNIDPTLDTYASKLLARIAKYIYIDKSYKSIFPSVRRDAWEWGCILAKIETEMPEATINEDFTLEIEHSYDPTVYHGHEASVKCFNKYVTFEVDSSIQGYQLKQAFDSATAMAGWISAIQTMIQNSLVIREDALVSGLFTTMIIDTLHAEDSTDTDSYFQTHSGVKVVNLLKLYNDLNPSNTLTFAECINNAEFIRFANTQIMLISDKMKAYNSAYNIQGKKRFTPKDRQRLVLLSDFATASKTYLYADTYNKEFVELGGYDTVPYWNGVEASGKGKNSFESCSTLGGKTETCTNGRTQRGVIGVLYDNEAIGTYCEEDKVDTFYNPKGSFTSYFYKRKCGNFAFEDEQFIVFVVDAQA